MVLYRTHRTYRVGYGVVQNSQDLSGTGNTWVNNPGVQKALSYRTHCTITSRTTVLLVWCPQKYGPIIIPQKYASSSSSSSRGFSNICEPMLSRINNDTVFESFEVHLTYFWWWSISIVVVWTRGKIKRVAHYKTLCIMYKLTSAV